MLTLNGGGLGAGFQARPRNPPEWSWSNDRGGRSHRQLLGRVSIRQRPIHGFGTRQNRTRLAWYLLTWVPPWCCACRPLGKAARARGAMTRRSADDPTSDGMGALAGDVDPPAALSLTRAGSFDSVGVGQVQVAQRGRRTCAAGLRALRGPLAAAMNRLPPALMRASIAVFPFGLTLRPAWGCSGRPGLRPRAASHRGTAGVIVCPQERHNAARGQRAAFKPFVGCPAALCGGRAPGEMRVRPRRGLLPGQGSAAAFVPCRG
jgi:hypothetical protein